MSVTAVQLVIVVVGLLYCMIIVAFLDFVAI